MRDAPDIAFASTVAINHREELENLLFFNANQSKVTKSILESIRRYGEPRIAIEGDRLQIVVGHVSDVQVLYAIAGAAKSARIVGVVIYVRDRSENLTIVHLAVAPLYIMAPSGSESSLALQLFSQVLAIARRIKGIRTVTIINRSGKSVSIKATECTPLSR